MKRKGARRVAILMAVIFVFAGLLAGCSSKGDKETTKPAATSDTKATAAPGDTAGEAGMKDGKYDPPIELTTVSNYTSLVKFDSGDDINNNMWTRYMLDTYGIKVTRKWATTSGEELQQKTNLMIASGDIPDFFAAEPQQFKQLSEAGLIEDLTEAYEKYAPPHVKQLMEEAGPEVLQSATIDGKLMAIPWTGLERESVPVVWIRSDWMKKLNLSAPQTMDDILKIADAFANQDPDGNQKKDTLGFMIDKDLNAAKGFLNGFHAYNNIWLKDASGKLVYSNIQPEMKAALGKLQEMFKGGQLDAEFAVKDMTKAFETIGANKVGMFFSDRGGANYPANTSLPNVEWNSYPVPSIDDQPAKLQHDLNIFGNYWVVKKGSKHPEAVLKVLEAFTEKFYFTTSDEDYKKFIAPPGDSNPVWFLAPAKMYRPLNNLESFRQVNAVLKGEKDASELTPQNRGVLDRINGYKGGDQSLWWEYAQNGPEGSGRIIEQYLKNDQFMPNQFTTTPTPAMISKQANLQAIMMETFTKIIMGTASLDEFDNFVSSWKKLGGDEMTKEVNDWYAKQ
ncbi:extracellular solute-binding protein [Paenibacillus eucommiae]|uniref:Aldouronate transport system substrate-binding protein n=1 Tax=Paenibacillus eucommiae TaxID=1355755 RepID=A0ABS4IT14_9BACL|nr:extracellular solute-binding protein [Paenibacillus eucommiae]MBP1990673.1 putative aldouronate transport system substrate-binding protein [Paenibacillus eucommiae]